MLVVVLTPSLQLIAGVRMTEEPMGVETLRSEAPIERLDECVVGWFPWPREVERNHMSVGPQAHVPGYELRPLINADGLGVAYLAADTIQCGDHVFIPVAEPWIENRDVSGARVDHGQDPDLPSRRELIMHEVHSPHIIGPYSF